jgi:hypothetical protein
VAEVAKRVHKWKPLTRRTPGAGLGAPATLYVGWADWQLGKSGGGGVEETTTRVLDSIEQTIRRLKDLRRLGRPVEAIHVWNMGDPTEGCDGNYASQLFTVELTRRQQLNLALDLWLTGVKAFAPLVDDLTFGSVLCNHGEWTRQGPGTKAVTSDSDNIGGYLADTLRTVLADRPDYDHVRFAIPHDEMTMLTHMSGVPVALAHGHKAPGLGEGAGVAARPVDPAAARATGDAGAVDDRAPPSLRGQGLRAVDPHPASVAGLAARINRRVQMVHRLDRALVDTGHVHLSGR